MNILGQLLPGTPSDSNATVSFGGNTFNVTAANYSQVADAYWTYQKNQYPGTITESDRAAYYDTFAEIAQQETRNFTLDSDGAAVPNGQGWGTYLWKTVTGGVSKSAAELNKKLPGGDDYKILLAVVALVAVVVLVKK